MKILRELKRVVALLQPYRGQWALCGGIAASIYRSHPRFTDDIDFVLVDGENQSAEDLALSIVCELGYEPYRGYFPDIANGELTLGLICARDSTFAHFVGVDFLLPKQPWIPRAVELAQENAIDFGFSVVPTITPECLILAKMVAVNKSPERRQDLDDIIQLLHDVQIDRSFVCREIKSYSIDVSQELLDLVSDEK